MSEQNYEIQRCGLSKDCAKLSRDFFHVSSALEQEQAKSKKLLEALEKIELGTVFAYQIARQAIKEYRGDK